MNNILLTSLIGLSGVILGTLITTINNHYLKTKETKLRIIEKVFDKRIQAHEILLTIVKDIRTVIHLNETDEDSNIIGFPAALQSKKELEKFIGNVVLVIHQNSHWFDTELTRELGFLQDYLITLENNSVNIDDEQLPQLGLIIKQDFIDLASSIENLAFEFFRKDIYKMKINKLNKWHKYPKEETVRRLNATNYYQRFREIENLKTN